MRALLTGGRGMLATAIAAAWRSGRPDDELVVLTRDDVDLRDDDRAARVIADAAPDLVLHAAALVGGIADKLARPLPYLVENLRIDAAVLNAVVAADVPAYVYIASAAAYPADADQPIVEEALFTGPLEPANEGYGLAKLAGLTAVGYAARQTGRAYRSILPSNLYGPGDHFDLATAHLIGAALQKTHDALVGGAPTVEVWGDGTARREFTYAPDLAAWLVAEADRVAEWPQVLNVGAGRDHSIREYYELARDVVGFGGDLDFDATRPAGVPQRLLDSSRARALGWSAPTPMHDGMAAVYAALLERLPAPTGGS